MRNMRKTISLLCVLALTASAMAGCKTSADKAPAETPGVASEVESTAAESVTEESTTAEVSNAQFEYTEESIEALFRNMTDHVRLSYVFADESNAKQAGSMAVAICGSDAEISVGVPEAMDFSMYIVGGEVYMNCKSYADEGSFCGKVETSSPDSFADSGMTDTDFGKIKSYEVIDDNTVKVAMVDDADEKTYQITVDTSAERITALKSLDDEAEIEIAVEYIESVKVPDEVLTSAEVISEEQAGMTMFGAIMMMAVLQSGENGGLSGGASFGIGD